MLIVAEEYFTGLCENVTKMYCVNYMMNQCGSTCNDLTNNFIVTLNTTNNRELRCVQKSMFFNRNKITIKISPDCEIPLTCYCCSNDCYYCNCSLTISETCHSLSQFFSQQTSNDMQADSCFIQNISAYLNNTKVSLNTISMSCTSES